jgi:hypothetical protein
MKTSSPTTTGLLALTLSSFVERQGKWKSILPSVGFRPSRPPRAKTKHQGRPAMFAMTGLANLASSSEDFQRTLPVS